MIAYLLGSTLLTAGLAGLYLGARHRLARLKHPGLIWLTLACLTTLAVLELARRTLS